MISRAGYLIPNSRAEYPGRPSGHRRGRLRQTISMSRLFLDSLFLPPHLGRSAKPTTRIEPPLSESFGEKTGGRYGSAFQVL